MRKRVLLAVMMLVLLTLVLTGCRLIVKDQAVDDATPILTLGDQVMTKKEVKEKIEAQLNYMANTYAQYGLPFDTTSEEAKSQAQDTVIAGLKQQMVLDAKIKDLKLDVLTDEELTKVKEDAEAQRTEDLDIVKAQYLTDEQKALEGEELDKAAADWLAENGITAEIYEENAKSDLINGKLRDYVIKDVEVTEDEVSAEYDSRVAADKEKYAESAGTWADASVNGTTLYYTPAGVRRVKQILIKFKEEDQKAIDEAKTAESAAETKLSDADKKIADAQAILDQEDASEDDKAKAQEDLTAAQADKEAAEKEHEETHAALDAALAAGFANIDADADQVLADLAGGADWDTLMAAKTEDPGMQGNSATAINGYAVASGMARFDAAFVDAAMALNAVGDVSEKVPSNLYGYYIIKYVSDEAEGAVALETVHDSIQSSLLSTKQNETYDATVKKWVDDADFKEDLDALKD